MTRNEIMGLIQDELARPNDTYLMKVVPRRLDEAIRSVERKWDWNFQYLETTISVAAGEHELVFDVPSRALKEITNNIYNVAEEYLCVYKKFYPFIVSAQPGRPMFYTVTPDMKIFLSARVIKDSVFYVPLRAFSVDYGHHPLFTEYPYEIVFLTQVMCKKDFIGTFQGYTRDDWLNDYRDAIGRFQDANMAEKGTGPGIIQLNYDIRRDLSWMGTGA